MRTVSVALLLGVGLFYAAGLTNVFGEQAVHAMLRSMPPTCSPFSGGFSSPLSISTGSSSHPKSITVADFDGDGYDDLAATNYHMANNGKVSVLINNESGNFVTPIPTYPSPDDSPVFLTATDINGDGAPDLVVANQGGATIGLLINSDDNTGTFPMTTPTLPTGMQPHGITYGNVTFSGIPGEPDLAVAFIGVPMCDIPGMAQVFLNEGSGTFCPMAAIPAGDQPHAIGAGDFNGDGTLELLVANGGNFDTQVTLLRGLGSGTFSMPDCPTRCFTTGQKPVNLAVGNFNGDTKPDFASANLKNASGTVTVGFNNGMGFTLQTLPVDSSSCTSGSTTQYVSDVAAGSLKGDGVLDLVVTNFCQNSVTIFPYDSGSGQFCTATPIKTLSLGMNKGPRSVALFHLHPTDTHMAIAVANDSDNSVEVLTF